MSDPLFSTLTTIALTASSFDHLLAMTYSCTGVEFPFEYKIFSLFASAIGHVVISHQLALPLMTLVGFTTFVWLTDPLYLTSSLPKKLLEDPEMKDLHLRGNRRPSFGEQVIHVLYIAIFVDRVFKDLGLKT